MGFDDVASDERPFALEVAEKLKLRNENFHSTESEVAATFDETWDAFDEPFADSSALPMLVLCREIRKRVKVAIGGDGGDEVWCGYPWHRALNRAERVFMIPFGIRRFAGIAGGAGDGQWRYKARVLAAPDRLGAWAALRTGLSDEMAKFLPVAAKPLPVRECFTDGADRDDLLVKADRASMRFGLELREPLLDHVFTAWGLTVPVRMRFDGKAGRGKMFARRYLSERIPGASFDRPKRGFTPPLRKWLNGPLKHRMSQALADLEAGHLAPLALLPGQKSWADCAEKLGDHHLQFLWRIICFSGWAAARVAA
jgi:asparagine synthase (glutamine-hydrolysing)